MQQVIATKARRLVDSKTDKVVWTFHVPASVYNKSTCEEYFDTVCPSWIPAGHYYITRGVVVDDELIWRRCWTGFDLGPGDDDGGSGSPNPNPVVSGAA